MRDPPDRFEIILYILGNFSGMIKIQKQAATQHPEKHANQKPG